MINFNQSSSSAIGHETASADAQSSKARFIIEDGSLGRFLVEFESVQSFMQAMIEFGVANCINKEAA